MLSVWGLFSFFQILFAQNGQLGGAVCTNDTPKVPPVGGPTVFDRAGGLGRGGVRFAVVLDAATVDNRGGRRPYAVGGGELRAAGDVPRLHQVVQCDAEVAVGAAGSGHGRILVVGGGGVVTQHAQRPGDGLDGEFEHLQLVRGQGFIFRLVGVVQGDISRDGQQSPSRPRSSPKPRLERCSLGGNTARLASEDCCDRARQRDRQSRAHDHRHVPACDAPRQPQNVRQSRHAPRYP